MTRLFQSGYESGDFALEPFVSPSYGGGGSASIVAGGTGGGASCGQYVGVSATSSYAFSLATFSGIGGRAYYGGAMMQFSGSLPASAVAVMGFVTSTGSFFCTARVTAAGKLQLWNEGSGTQVGSDSAASIAAGAWHRVELKLLIGSGARDALELRLDGTVVATASALSLSDALPGGFRVGLCQANAVAATLLVDEVALNDAAGDVDAAYPSQQWARHLPAFLVAASSADAAVKAAADYVCDGTADDVEIQAALDALPVASSGTTGGTVQLSLGTFTLAAAIKLRTGQTLRGMGHMATMLNAGNLATGNAVQAKDTTTGYAFARVEDLWLYGNSTCPTGIGMVGLTESEVRRCRIGYFATSCVELGGNTDASTYSNVVEDCHLENTPTCVHIFGKNSSNNGTGNWNRICRCLITPTNATTSVGVSVADGDSNLIEDCDISYAANAYGVKLLSGYRNRLLANRFEAIGQAASNGSYSVDIASGAFGSVALGNVYTDANNKPVVHDANVGGNATVALDCDAGTSLLGQSVWSGQHAQLGVYHLWVDAVGKLRIKGSAPTSDTDGVTVGSQT